MFRGWMDVYCFYNTGCLDMGTDDLNVTQVVSRDVFTK